MYSKYQRTRTDETTIVTVCPIRLRGVSWGGYVAFRNAYASRATLVHRWVCRQVCRSVCREVRRQVCRWVRREGRRQVCR